MAVSIAEPAEPIETWRFWLVAPPLTRNALFDNHDDEQGHGEHDSYDSQSLRRAVAQGIDPVHFGIITVVNLEIGYLTPPLGLNLIVAMTVFRVDFWTVCRAVVPFALLMLIGLQIVTFWPGLSLVLLR